MAIFAVQCDVQHIATFSRFCAMCYVQSGLFPVRPALAGLRADLIDSDARAAPQRRSSDELERDDAYDDRSEAQRLPVTISRSLTACQSESTGTIRVTPPPQRPPTGGVTFNTVTSDFRGKGPGPSH